jgi:predicted PolB exonuclease-like 3'-5' exonuclease
MQQWAGYNQRISLDDLAKVLGLKSHKGEMDGSKVFEAFQKKKHEDIEKYCMDDTLLTADIYKRIK